MNNLNNEENIIIQGLLTMTLLTELKKDNFLNSSHYTKMKFDNENLKDLIKKIGIDNQGCFLIAFYVMLVVPKEKLFNQYENEFNDINTFIDSIKINVTTTYKDDIPTINYVRHLRNAIAHMNIEFTEKTVIFEDSYNNSNFELSIYLSDIGNILMKLQNILYKYINTIHNTNNI